MAKLRARREPPKKNRGGRPRANPWRDITVYMFVRRGLESGLPLSRSYEAAGKMLFGGDEWLPLLTEDPICKFVRSHSEDGSFFAAHSSFTLSGNWFPGILAPTETLTPSGMRAAYVRGLREWKKRSLEKDFGHLFKNAKNLGS